MLLSQTTVVRPKKNLRKILYLYPAQNNTFVILGMKGIRQDTLWHINAKGQILYQFVFDKPMDAFGMMNYREAIMLQTRKNRIVFIDLQNPTQHRYITHYFFNQQSDQADILTFSCTKYLAIVQYGRYNDNRFMATYYPYPKSFKQQYNKIKPIHKYESKDDQWTYEYIFKRGNNHSMMIWFRAKVYDVLQIKIYQQNRDSLNWKLQKYKISVKNVTFQTPSDFQIQMYTMWEMTKGKLLTVCSSNRPDIGDKEDKIYPKNNFIIDLEAQILFQTQFYFGKLQDYLIDCYYMGDNSMFRSFKFQGGKSVPTSVFYVKNQTQEIIAQDEWICSYKSKYFFPGYDGNSYIEAQYENEDVSEFKCHHKRIVTIKQITVHLLLGLNQDFDEDLLYDVVAITEYSK